MRSSAVLRSNAVRCRQILTRLAVVLFGVKLEALNLSLRNPSTFIRDGNLGYRVSSLQVGC